MDNEISTTTSSAVTINQLEPYLMDSHYGFNANNGLLLFLIVYLLIKDISKFIYKFIFGGNI